MLITLGRTLLDIDVERTRAFCATAPTMGRQCDCLGCRNYDRAVEHLPQEWQRFFDDLGLDPRRPVETYVNDVSPEGLTFYEGWFHLCGRILRGGKRNVPGG